MTGSGSGELRTSEDGAPPDDALGERPAGGERQADQEEFAERGNGDAVREVFEHSQVNLGCAEFPQKAVRLLYRRASLTIRLGSLIL